MSINFNQQNQLNINIFSPEIRFLIESAEKKFQAPRPIIVSALMTALATAMQDYLVVEVPTGIMKSVSLSIATIAESGDRKTTVHQAFLKPIYDQDKQAEVDFQQRQNTFDKEDKLYRIKEKILRDNLRNAIRGNVEDQAQHEMKLVAYMDQKPQLPVLQAKCHSNTTIAALLKNMAQGPKGHAFISTEAGGNISNLKKEDIANLIQLMDGDSIKVDRVTTDSFHIKDKKLTCSFSIQPTIYEDIISKKGTILMDSGLLPRMLISSSYSLQGYRHQGSADHSPNIGAFHERLKELLQHSDEIQQKYSNIIMKFDNEAAHAWNTYAAALEQSLSPDGWYRDIKYWVNRMSENVARFAALIEFYQYGKADKPIQYITLPSLNMAFVLGNFWLNEAKKLFGDGTGPQQQLAKADQLLEYLRRNHNPNNYWYAKKQLYTNGPRGLRSSAEMQMAIDIAVSQGYLAMHVQNPNLYCLTESFLRKFIWKQNTYSI